MGLRRHWLGQQRGSQVLVTARWQHDGSPEHVGIPFHPVLLLRRGSPMWPRESVDDEPEGLTTGVRIDCLEDANHSGTYANTHPQEDICLLSTLDCVIEHTGHCGLSFAICLFSQRLGERPWGIGTGGGS